MSVEPGTVPMGTLARTRQAIDQHDACIQRLEEAEQRLREQDATYSDPRIATRYKELFEMLARLLAIECVRQGEYDQAPQISEASARDAEGMSVMLQRVLAQLIIKTRPTFSGLNVHVDSAEDEWNSQLGDRGRR